MVSLQWSDGLFTIPGMGIDVRAAGKDAVVFKAAAARVRVKS